MTRTPLATAILGVWKLQSRTDTDTRGLRRIDPALGEDPLGILCFADGHFAAQFMKRDRSSGEAGRAPGQVANNSMAVDGYDAYFGTYEVDERQSVLTVHLTGAISPSNIGSSFRRDISVRHDTLTIRLETTAADGAPVTRTLVFSRLG